MKPHIRKEFCSVRSTGSQRGNPSRKTGKGQLTGRLFPLHPLYCRGPDPETVGPERTIVPGGAFSYFLPASPETFHAVAPDQAEGAADREVRLEPSGIQCAFLIRAFPDQGVMPVHAHFSAVRPNRPTGGETFHAAAYRTSGPPRQRSLSIKGEGKGLSTEPSFPGTTHDTNA